MIPGLLFADDIAWDFAP